MGPDLDVLAPLRGAAQDGGDHADGAGGGDDSGDRIRDEAGGVRQHAERHGQPAQGPRRPHDTRGRY